MSRMQKRLLCRAYRRHPNMRPVGYRPSYEQCFTKTEYGMILWYDTPDRGTHLVLGGALSALTIRPIPPLKVA